MNASSPPPKQERITYRPCLLGSPSYLATGVVGSSGCEMSHWGGGTSHNWQWSAIRRGGQSIWRVDQHLAGGWTDAASDAACRGEGARTRCTSWQERLTSTWRESLERQMEVTEPDSAMMSSRSSSRWNTRIFFSEQMLTSVEPSWVTARSFILCPFHCATTCPSMFHMYVHLSSPPLTKRFPSGIHAHAVTLSVCLVKVCMHDPVATSHSLM
mmetsp:Transcript_735/g.2501  ORF Transcript_735/g.2501 Transcript_735/m.2501 type:complete len:213 (+) Transcript_735:2247-2885(+)